MQELKNDREGDLYIWFLPLAIVPKDTFINNYRESNNKIM